MVYRSAVLLFSLLMLTNGGARADGIQSTEIAGTAFRVILKSGRELGPRISWARLSARSGRRGRARRPHR